MNARQLIEQVAEGMSRDYTFTLPDGSRKTLDIYGDDEKDLAKKADAMSKKLGATKWNVGRTSPLVYRGAR